MAIAWSPYGPSPAAPPPPPRALSSLWSPLAMLFLFKTFISAGQSVLSHCCPRLKMHFLQCHVHKPS